MKAYLRLLPRLALVVVIGLITVVALSPMLLAPQSVVANDTSTSGGFVASQPIRAFQTDGSTRPNGTDAATRPDDDDDDDDGDDPAGLPPLSSLASQSGYPAATAAVFPSADGGLDLYFVDPITGVGTFYMTLTTADIAAARAAAASSGQNTLIVPQDGDFTIEEIEAILPQIYALATGGCGLLTSFPDGKTAVFPFDC